MVPTSHPTLEMDSVSKMHPGVAVGEYLLQCLRKNALTCKRPAEIDLETSLEMSYSELLESSIQAAVGWRKRGLKRGDYIAVICKNRMDLIPAVLGAIFEGVTVTFMIPSSTEAEIRSFLSLVPPRAVLSGPSNHSVVRRACDPDVLHVVAGDCDDAVTVRSLMAQDVVRPEQYEAVPIRDWHEHTAMVLFSSGTTGMPKAVAFSNYSVYMIAADPMDNLGSLFGERVLITSPLSWLTGVLFHLISISIGTTRIIGSFTDEVEMIRVLEKYQVTCWFLAPPRLILLADTVQRMSPRPALDSLRVMISGGGVLDAAAQLRVSQQLDTTVFLFYGCTEMGVVTRERAPIRPGSSGRQSGAVHLRIVDVNTGEDITTPGVTGELRCKSVYQMRCYVGNPEATRNAFDDRGYFRMGDLGYRDEDGYFFILERIKELIKYNSMEMAPAELEAVLVTHPGVLEACVVGRPHPRLGDLPTAFVVRAPGSSVTEEQLQALVAGRLSDFKKLRGGVYFVNEIPKNINGKMERRTLRDKLSKDPEFERTFIDVDAKELEGRVILSAQR